LLVEFARAERLWRLRDLEGRRLTSIVEMLGRGPAAPGLEGERDFLRYVGDFALFMSGMFRPWAERGGFLGVYVADGALAYARVAALGDAVPRRERLILAELATRFEPYAGALDYLRRVHLTSLAGPDALRAFLREIEAPVGRASRTCPAALRRISGSRPCRPPLRWPPSTSRSRHGAVPSPAA